MIPTQHASPRARLILARHAMKSSQGQQSRNLSLNPWSSHGSGRRHRIFAYRYMDSLNRHLSWDNNPRIENSRAAMRKVVAEWLQSSNPHHSNKYTNLNDVKSWSDDLSGVRPGRNIEDVERDAINRLFNKDDTVWAPLQNIRNYLHASRTSSQVTPENVLRATASARDSIIYIDPITNRRVTQEERGKYSATKFDDPNAPRKLTPEERSKLYKDLGQYKPATWNEPDGLPDMTPEEQSKQYDDLHKYSTTKVDNPNAPQKLTPEEESKLYNDLDKYKPVTWNEPDGLQRPTLEEQSKNYDDLDKYGPVQWNEPNGLQEPTPEEKTKNYKDLHKYGPVAWDEPNGLRRLTPEEKSKNYDDLDSYSQPFVAKDSVLEAHEALQNDPTPKAEPIPAKVEVHSEATTTQYDDLDKYGPVYWNEPDGLRPLTAEERSKNYEDLHQYAQYDNAGPKTPRIHPEEASKQYQDLPKYSVFPNAGPETERIHPEEASKRYKDLHGYAVDGYIEPEKTRHIHPEELTKNYSDLHKYEPQSFDSPQRTYPIHPEEASKAYKDLRHYKAAPADTEGPKETPDVVAASLKSYDSKVKTQADMAASSAKHRSQHVAGVDVTGDSSIESMTPDDVRDQVMRRAGMDKVEADRNLESSEVEMSSMDESFPMEDSKSTPESIESISNKLAEMRAERDPYSSDPKGLETSYSEECGSETEPTLVKHYEAKTSSLSGAPESTSAAATYKILAYDPTTQSINIAETTSSDHDTSSPPKLTDVLLQLSHASKFLPYFQTLQAQGYDIVSGGGDVLIFRKNRPAAADAGDLPTGSIKTARVNPVDMMGRSITGNFASPTGFVNYYDTMEEGHDKPAPPYRSYAYAQSQSSQAKPGAPEKKKRSLGKKLVMGTVWVGGVAYAVGALSEHLSTSGK